MSASTVVVQPRYGRTARIGSAYTIPTCYSRSRTASHVDETGIPQAAEGRVRQTLPFCVFGDKEIENLERRLNNVFSTKTSESSQYRCHGLG